MATLYITEYGEAGPMVPAPLASANLAEQHLAIGGSSAPSAALNDATAFVMINTDSVCSLAFGTNPTAVATAQRMSANETRFYNVPRGAKYKIAVIANT